MGTCIQWAEERVEECTEWRDEGHNECDEWDSQCCTWWPCSWACTLATWVCVGYVWIANVVCVGWTLFTTAVCIAWDIATTIINAVVVSLESTLGWVLSAIAFVVELIEMIPILGTLVRWVINFVTFVVWSVVSLLDAGLGLIGIRPEKILRVCTIILRNEEKEDGKKGDPVATLAYARALLQMAADIYKRDANVRIVPLRPFKYSTGFLDAEQVTDDWIQIDDASGDADTLDVPCDGAGVGMEWWLTGTKFQAKSSLMCFYGAWRRILGYGAPVTCFIIRSLPNASGCCLWITDYATMQGGDVPPSNPRVLAHEVGHASNLWHICVDDDVANLMAIQTVCNSPTLPNTANPQLSNWQVLLVRASKHVTYF
jgi:hypothetical protein